MFLYKKIKFEDCELITEQLLSIVKEYNYDAEISRAFDINLIHKKVPRLLEQFHSMNIEIDVFREFVSSPYQGLKIHADGTAEHPKFLALNWPVENCENTKMIWWNFKEEPKRLADGYDMAFGNVPLKFYSEENGIKIGECEIVSPTLVNVKEYHSVVNGPNTRRMVSFRFKPEPLHLLD
jgi:hypothetical protein